MAGKAAAPQEPGFFQRLFGSPTKPPGGVAAYARTDDSILPPRDAFPKPSVNGDRTAVYDISAGAVTLPSGKRLEAHSGLAGNKDNPASAHVRMRGVTPPNVYALSMRESLFHGVRAIRLTPVDNGKMFGRDGMLAHTYMLGPGGDSNGCVVFRDYNEFLNAFLRGEVTRLVVVSGSSPRYAQREQ